eukprot:9504137-Pyramimonas_sp.AAC.1
MLAVWKLKGVAVGWREIQWTYSSRDRARTATCRTIPAAPSSSYQATCRTIPAALADANNVKTADAVYTTQMITPQSGCRDSKAHSGEWVVKRWCAALRRVNQ